MSRTINVATVDQVCAGVWRDRAAILTCRGALSGEAALMRAVYWRLCKAGGAPDQNLEAHYTGHTLFVYQQLVDNVLAQYTRPPVDGAPFLEELIRQYRAEDD